MVEITNKKDLERWLQKQLRSVAVAIAARAALRVLPAIETWFRINERKAFITTLPLFRANTVSLFAATQPIPYAKLVKIARAAADGAAYAADIAYAAHADSAYTAIYSAADAAETATFTVADAAIRAVYAAAITAADASFWSSIKHDAQTIENGISSTDLIGHPLWPDSIPDWANDLWRSMKRRLLAREGEHWEVWTNWYDARLDPSKHIPCYSPPNWELERERVLLPEDLWKQGPAVVNAEIKKLIEKYRTAGKCGPHPPPPPPSEPEKDKQEEPKEPSTALKTSFTSDVPVGDVDYLGRAELTRVLAAQLNEMWDEQASCHWDNWDEGRPAPGFVVHIDAPWGGGKTSFAALTAKILNPWANGAEQPRWLKDLGLDNEAFWPERYRRPWRIVWFNAWQHEHLNPPWWSFYETIRNQIFRSIRQDGKTCANWLPPDRKRNLCFCDPACGWWKGIKLRLLEFFWILLTKDRTFTIIGFSISFLLLLILWQAGIIHPTGDTRAQMPLGLTGSWGAIIGILLGGSTLISKVLASLRRIFLPGQPEEADNRVLGTTDPLNRMRDHFRKLLERVSDPVLVIVDDLDRCQPRYVVELIRGMQTVLNSPRVIFMLLGDRDWIEQAFEAVHKEMKGLDVGPEHDFGGRFMEKAIQFSLILPEISESQRQQFMRHVLRVETGQVQEAPSVQEAEPLPEEMQEKLKHILETPAFAERERQAAELLQQTELHDTTSQKVQILLSRRATADDSTKTFIRHELEALAPVLPANPRQMKRIINAINILQEVVRLNDPVRHPGSADWYKLVRWVVLMIEWPRTWVTLTKKPELLTRNIKSWPDWLKNDNNVRRLITGQGLPEPWDKCITQEDIKTWLAPNIPAASGKPWPENS